MSKTTVEDLKKGETAKIVSINDRGQLNRRIRDMGIVPGTEITVTGRAPLGDPISIKAKGFHLSIRRNEAQKIIVEVKNENSTCRKS